MADGIYYNQEVTAEMLNGIAHDLGHTSFSGFGTDKFGADALNGITKDLVTAGVLLTGNQCKVVRSEDGKIILQDGIIVFANGAKKVISEPLTIDADNGTAIYAYNNVAAGTCTIEVAESFPGDGDYVKLAIVNADGAITDNRNYSIANALKSAVHTNEYIDFEITHSVWSGAKAETIAEGAQSTYIMPHNQYKYLFLIDSGNHRRQEDYFDISDLSDGESVSFNFDSSNYFMIVIKNGAELTFISERAYIESSVSEVHTMKFELV